MNSVLIRGAELEEFQSNLNAWLAQNAGKTIISTDYIGSYPNTVVLLIIFS